MLLGNYGRATLDKRRLGDLVDLVSNKINFADEESRKQDTLGRVYEYFLSQFASQEGCQPPEVASPGLLEEVTIREFGTRFRVCFASGHKTGFFCDQRENRKRLADFCEDRSVLDLCCYTGGFAVQAMRLGKAREASMEGGKASVRQASRHRRGVVPARLHAMIWVCVGWRISLWEAGGASPGRAGGTPMVSQPFLRFCRTA